LKFTEISFLLQQQIYLSEKLGKKQNVQKSMKLFNQRFGLYMENLSLLNRESRTSFLASTSTSKIRKDGEKKNKICQLILKQSFFNNVWNLLSKRIL